MENKIEYRKVETDTGVIIKFRLSDNIAPTSLITSLPPDPVKENFAHKGIVLSGRGPVWLFCYLCHYYHPTLFVAVYDPRLQGAVVVQSHGNVKAGEVIFIDSNLIS